MFVSRSCRCRISLDWHGHPRSLHSFPTRRSSDLIEVVSEPQRGSAFVVYLPVWDEAQAAARLAAESPAVLLDRLAGVRSEEHTTELQSPYELVCRRLLEQTNKRVHDQP